MIARFSVAELTASAGTRPSATTSFALNRASASGEIGARAATSGEGARADGAARAVAMKRERIENFILND